MKAIFLFFSIIFLNNFLAKSQDSTQQKSLNEVIVTGQYKPQSLKKSVYQVKTILKDRIVKQGAVKLQDVLANELNIRFNNDMATGGSDITMLGLKGQNVKILIDGLPLVGRQGTSNEININQIDINTIERIEIVEGPMSVVYGADALAGVINIITKKNTSSKLTVTARLHEETIGKEYGLQQGIHNYAAGLSYKYKNWEVGGNIGYNFFGGFKDTAVGRELVWHKKDQILGSGFIGFTKDKFNVRYRIDGLDEVITNPGNFLFYQQASGDTLAYDQEYLTNRVMHQLQAGYIFSNKLNLQWQNSFSNYNRQVFSTTVSKKTNDVRLNTAGGAQSTINFKGFTSRFLATYKVNEKFSLQPGAELNIETGEGERLAKGNNQITDFAFFVTGEIAATKKISIKPGFRIIKNSVYNAPPIVPSINAKIILSNDIDVRLSYAQGFRSPSLRELYFNFFDANHQIIGNENLKAETSNSFTGSVNWQKKSSKNITYSAIFSGFYNIVNNLIDYAVSANDPNVFVLSNVTNSKTAGSSILFSASKNNWKTSIGGSYTGFYNDYAEQNKTLPQMQWSAEINSTSSYTFTKLGLTANLFYKFTGERPFYVVQNNNYLLAKNKGFHWAEFTLNKSIKKLITLNAGVRNLFNVGTVNSTIQTNGVHSNSGVRNIGNGTSYFVGINFNWDKK
jgi:outer membrane receptor for ferrienterochelin and colicins